MQTNLEMGNLSKHNFSLGISLSTTDLMDIIQDEVQDDSILFDSVMTGLGDYIFSGPSCVRGARIVCNHCVILYMCL